MMRGKYEALDYLYTNGGYIDTGFSESDYIFHIKCSTSPSTPWVFSFMSSGRSTGNSDRFYSGIKNDFGNGNKNAKILAQGCGAVFHNITLHLTPTEPHEYEFQLGIEPNSYWAKIDGVYIIPPTKGSKSYSVDRTMKLYYNFVNLNYGYVYYTKIYKGNMLLRDFIPVRRRSDGKIGMLDKVEGKFYTSSSGAEFTGG